MPLPQKGLEHGVGHPSGLWARQQHLRTQGKKLREFRCHSQWPKVADAVIEAQPDKLKIWSCRVVGLDLHQDNWEVLSCLQFFFGSTSEDRGSNRGLKACCRALFLSVGRCMSCLAD